MKQIVKNSQEVIRIDSQEYKGKQLVDIRVWRKTYRNTNGGYARTKKGLTISADLVGELHNALCDLITCKQPVSLNDFGRL